MTSVILSALVLLMGFSPVEGPRTYVSIRFECESSAAPNVAALTLRRMDGGEPSIRRFVTEESNLIDIEPGRWIVTTVAKGYWAPELLLDTSELLDGPFVIKVWPAGSVAGEFVGEEPAPASFRLQIDTPEGTSTTVPHHTYSYCRVHGRTWECMAPVGRWDLSVRPEGFIPSYHWGITVDHDKTASLGKVALKQGASLSGWLTEPVPGAVVTLRRHIPTGPDPQLREKLSQPQSVVRPNERGFFVFEGMEAGMWVIEATAPDHALTAAGPFETKDGAETAIRRPIEILRPGSVDLMVSPGKDPLGGEWRLEVWPSRESGVVAREPVFHGQLDGAGIASVTNVRPGKYTVFIHDSQGSRYSMSDIEVHGEVRTLESITIRYVRIGGRVTLGGEPVPGKIWFGGKRGTVSVHFVADDDGTFSGVLPGSGQWPFAFASRDGTIDVESFVEVEDGDEEAAVLIDLPDNRLAGVVLDQEGKAADQAKVSLAVGKVSRSDVTDSDGSFEFRCVPAGTARVQAFKGRGGIRVNSPSHTIEVADNLKLDGIELRLGTTREIQGRVMDGTRPVVGASVLLVSETGASASATSGIDGAFSVELDQSSTTISAFLRPAGYSFDAHRVDDLTRPLRLEVGRDGGRLMIEIPGAPEARSVPSFIITKDGIRVAPSILYDWARGNGEQFYTNGVINVPNLGRGRYEICRFSSNGKQQVCDEGFLSPGGSLTLRLPELPDP